MSSDTSGGAVPESRVEIPRCVRGAISRPAIAARHCRHRICARGGWLWIHRDGELRAEHSWNQGELREVFAEQRRGMGWGCNDVGRRSLMDHTPGCWRRLLTGERVGGFRHFRREGQEFCHQSREAITPEGNQGTGVCRGGQVMPPWVRSAETVSRVTYQRSLSLTAAPGRRSNCVWPAWRML